MKSIKVNQLLAVVSVLVGLALCTTSCSGPHSGRGISGKGKPPSKAEMLSENDKDKDGRLSIEEFPGPDEHFLRFDINEDGYLDLDELPDRPPREKGKR